MIITPVDIPDAALPLPDPNDLASWAARMAEQHRWMRNDLQPGANALGEACYENALDAQASAAAAAALSGAALWNAATNYPTGAAVISPTNLQTYRRNSPGGVNATDPSSSALWTRVGDTTAFATATENANGAIEGKSVDPLGIREALNAQASAAPIYAVRAWATITGSSGAIKASGNIATVTRLGPGRYRCTFNTAAPDANYMVQVNSNQNNAAAGSSDAPDAASYTLKTAAGFDFSTWNSSTDGQDDMFEVSICALW